MKNLIIALTLFVSLLVFGTFVVTRSIEAQKADVLAVLLEMPAPPPANPFLPNNFSERSEEFYSKKNPPADNAPIEELLDYWKAQSQRFEELGYNIQPSGRTLDRILGEIEKDPGKIADFLNILPENSETADLIKRIYDQQDSNEDEDGDYRKNQIKNWLKNHTDYFSDELFAEAQQVGDTEVGYVTNQESLLALARVNWNKAQSLINRMYNDASQPVSQTLARWALYRHALDTDSLGDIERYRDELKADVENKKAADGLRDLALDALVKEKDWSGRDDWYYGLLEDETLADLRVGGSSYTGLTTLVLYSSPDKYADKMIELLKSSNPAVRNAAIRNLGTLLDEKNIEIIRALLPWLEDENWATEMRSERQALVTALANFEVPESVPGLIALLDEKSSPEEPEDAPIPNANVMTNTGRVLANVAIARRNEESYPFRSSAIMALAKQKDVRAVPALRRILPQVDAYERAAIVRAILLSHGFSTGEQIEALETAAVGVKEEMETEAATGKINLANRIPVDSEDDEEADFDPPQVMTVTNMSVNSMNYNTARQQPLTAAVIKEILGQQIIENPEPSAELLTALIQRINTLDRSNPPIANALRRIILNWNGAGVNLILLNDLKNNKADINEVIKLLTVRKQLKEKQPNDVYAVRSAGSAFALGISACLLDTPSDYNALLVSENAEAKAAMFGCARLIRAELPVRIVAQNLNSPNKPLALAAERYIEAEDSAEARQILLAKYPNQAKILGATKYFGEDVNIQSAPMIAALFKTVAFVPWFEENYLFYDTNEEKLNKTEKKLQEEVKTVPELLGVYAYDDNFVRIYGDRVMFSYAEDESRYRERYLTETEFDNLKNYLAANRVDELKPFLSYCEGCNEKELLMLGRQGGQRVFFKGDTPQAFFAGLDEMFEEMRKPPAKLRYELEKFVPGLEILFADENFQAATVWKNGTDLRLLIADKKLREQIEAELKQQESEVKYDENTNYEQVNKANRERRMLRAFDDISWRRIVSADSFELTASPPDFFYPPARDGFSVLPSPDQWKAKTANLEIRADTTGLYKISGGTIKKIREGFYDSPLVTPDGRWTVVSKFDQNEGMKPVRVNLLNGQEFEIKIGGTARFEPIAILPSGKKLLFRTLSYEQFYSEMRETQETLDKMPRNSKVFTLDVETGAIENIKGEFRPLAQQTFRPLQKAASADEYWAAIPEAKATQVGIYNLKTFSFKPLMTIPQIAFSSMSMWVDEAENKVYFVYKDQLLALSFAKK